MALEQVTPVVENELRRIARRCMALEQAGHILQSAALVNRVCLGPVDVQSVDWQHRAHFFAMCAPDAPSPKEPRRRFPIFQ